MSLNNLSFQSAQCSDVDILVGFVRDFYVDHHLPFDESWVAQSVNTLINHPDWGEIWCIHQGDRPIGYAVLTFGYSLEYGGQDAFIDEIYLIPSARGQGVGTETLNFLCDRCLALGIGSLHLEVEQENWSAQRVYRKAGFIEHNRILMTKEIQDNHYRQDIR